MEEDLIDRNWLLKEIDNDLGCYDFPSHKQVFADLRDIARMIKSAPKSGPTKHGKWVRTLFCNELSCSICGDPAMFTKSHNQAGTPYCPICGARMDL